MKDREVPQGWQRLPKTLEDGERKPNPSPSPNIEFGQVVHQVVCFLTYNDYDLIDL